jgi:hypothetical protein
LAFQLAPGPGDAGKLLAHCLSWNGAGMHVCASYFDDGFELGRTSDLALRFEMLLVRHDVVRPRECPENTTSGRLCPSAWSKTCWQMGLCTPSGGGAPGFVDAGGGQRSEPGPDYSVGGGCGCHYPRPRPVSFTALLLVVGLLLVRRRGRSFS